VSGEALPLSADRGSSLSRVLLQNVASLGLARGGSLLLDGIGYVLVARYLGPTDYGAYVSILAFLFLVDFAGDMTLLDITVREIAKERARRDVWLTAATALRGAFALLGLVAYAAYLYIGRARFLPELGTAALVAALVLPVGALRMPLALFRAELKIHYELLVTLAARASNLLMLLLVIRAHGGLLQLFVVVLATRSLWGILSWALAVYAFGARPSWSGEVVLRLLRESLPMGLAGLFVAIQLKLDILLVSALLGARAGGLYGVLAQLPEYFLYIPVILTTPILPVLSRLHAEGGRERFCVLYQRLFDSLMALVTPVVVAAFLMPRELVGFVFGPRFADASVVLPLLALSIAFMWFSHATAIATVATGLQDSFIWIQSICVAVYLLLNATLITSWGLTGAAGARLVATALAPFLTYAVVRRRAGFGLDPRTFLRTAVAGLAMAVAVVAARPWGAAPALVLGVLAFGIVLVRIAAPRFAWVLPEERA
jgi:O-antigen/teichoic acid export membrane protein